MVQHTWMNDRDSGFSYKLRLENYNPPQSNKNVSEKPYHQTNGLTGFTGKTLLLAEKHDTNNLLIIRIK